MAPIQKLAWVYAIGFFSVVAIGYIPGFTDENGMLLGSFSIQPIDDVLHAASGIWAAYAAWKSAKASRFYFRAFGSFYTLDVFIGFFTGYAILDFVTGNWGANAGYSMMHVSHNLAVNLPHFIIGPVAFLIGFVFSPKLMKKSKKK